jgi:hypothetical protein
LVVDPEQVKDGGVEVVNFDAVLHYLATL